VKLRVFVESVFSGNTTDGKLAFVRFVTPALAQATQNGQRQRHFSMSQSDKDVEKYCVPLSY
jgi:hypothetical protein